MTKQEIQKELYKQKPVAEFGTILKGVAYYSARISTNHISGEDEVTTIYFQIPVVDMGDANFNRSMDAKLLGRWIVTQVN